MMKILVPTAHRCFRKWKILAKSIWYNHPIFSHNLRGGKAGIATLSGQRSLCNFPNLSSVSMSCSRILLTEFKVLSSVPRFVANGYHASQELPHINAVNQALNEVGIAVVDLKFPDPGGTYLSDLVLALARYHGHGFPIEHSATRCWYWDVRPMEKTVNRARSETCEIFPWHTDCSYESCPPRFFGLHVLRADQCGGGMLRLLNTKKFLHRLSSSAYGSLSRPDFRITVPQEFFKGINSINGNVILEDDGKGDVCMRYRSDIIQPLSGSAERALQELHELLTPEAEAKIRDITINMTPQDLPDNSIVLIDNGRWLHSRTEVKDLKRHLRRLRWGRRQFAP